MYCWVGRTSWSRYTIIKVCCFINPYLFLSILPVQGISNSITGTWKVVFKTRIVAAFTPQSHVSTKCQPSLFILSSPGKHIRGCRGKHGQRQTTPVPWQSPIVRAGSGLDPRKKSGGDSDEARQMQVFNQIGPGSGPLCQNPQHRGVFLQVALSDCVHFSEYCLLALLWRNSGVNEKYIGLQITLPVLWLYIWLSLKQLNRYPCIKSN